MPTERPPPAESTVIYGVIPILSASSYFMKSPPVQYNDHDAKDTVEAFIKGRRRTLIPYMERAGPLRSGPFA